MPCFEYFCDECDTEFEEILTISTEIEEYFSWHPCPNCRERAERIRVAAVSFNFAGGVSGTSGVHGNSGVHDLDYPVLDKAVGRSSEKKWEVFRQKKAEQDRVRKQSGQVEISVSGNTVAPTDASTIESRKKAMGLFKQAKSKLPKKSP